jgi:hypothetical protein
MQPLHRSKYDVLPLLRCGEAAAPAHHDPRAFWHLWSRMEADNAVDADDPAEDWDGRPLGLSPELWAGCQQHYHPQADGPAAARPTLRDYLQVPMLNKV